MIFRSPLLKLRTVIKENLFHWELNLRRRGHNLQLQFTTRRSDLPFTWEAKFPSFDVTSASLLAAKVTIRVS